MFDEKTFSCLNVFNFVSSLTCPGEIEPGLTLATSLGLFPPYPTDRNQYKCFLTDQCNGYLNPMLKSTCKLNYIYRCWRCNKTISPTKGTWFEGARLPFMAIFEIIYLWCAREPSKRIMEETETNKNTAVDYNHFCREIVIEFLLNLNKKVGGKGKHVEIDESLIWKRKYNRGRLLQTQQRQIWVVGGIERESGQCFMEIVPNRTKETLTNIILKNVERESTIYTDMWPAYNDLEAHGYYHGTVNHSKSFVNTNNPQINTQRIERLWKSVKDLIPKETNGDIKFEYLTEFIFRKQYFEGKKPGERFKFMLQLMAEQFKSPLFDYKV